MATWPGCGTRPQLGPDAPVALVKAAVLSVSDAVAQILLEATQFPWLAQHPSQLRPTAPLFGHKPLACALRIPS